MNNNVMKCLLQLLRFCRGGSFVFFLVLRSVPSMAGYFYAQDVRISLDMKNTTIHDVLVAIEKKGECYFVYDVDQIDVNRKVSIKVRNEAINYILDRLFSGIEIDFDTRDNRIILYKRDIPDMTGAKSQEVLKINGKVVDKTGEGIIGATVLEKGTLNGTATDVNGKFELSVSAKEVVLEISCIGFSKAIVSAKVGVPLTITLQEEVEALEEVVVVGYGTQKKIDLTGAISTVKADEILTNRPVSNLSAALQGSMPGLQITTGNSAPGGEPDLNIRGMNSINGGNPLEIGRAHV